MTVEARTLPIAPSTSAPVPALKPPAPRDGAGAPATAGGPVLAENPGLCRQCREAEFLDHAWQAKHSITNVPKLLAALKGLVPEDFFADAEAGFKGAPMSVRVSPYLLSLIDWSAALRGSAAHPVHPGGLAPPARPPVPGPGLLARAQGHAGARADPPLPGQGAVPGAGHLPGLLPVLHPQLRRGPGHRRGGEVPPAGQRRALAADLRLHRLAPRAGGHRHLRRRRLSAAGRADHPDRRVAAGHPPRAPLPLCHQGAGGDAPEAADRPRLVRRPHSHRGEGADPAQGGGAAHPLQPPGRDHRADQGGPGSPGGARDHRAQPDRAAARGERQLRHPGAAGQAPEPT